MAFNAGDIEAKLKLNRDEFKLGLDQARDEVRSFEDEDHQIRLGINTDLDGARLEIDDFRDEQELRDIKIPVTVDKDQAEKDMDEAMSKVKKSAEASGESGGAGLLPILIGLATIPGSAAIAGAALTAVPLAFGVAAAILLKNNADIKNSWSVTLESMKAQLTADAGPMTQTFEQIAQNADFAFHDMGDMIQLSFQGANPAVALFSQGLLGLITNLVPGVQSAVGASLPTIAGMNSLLEQTGTGMTGLLTGMSSGSVQAGQGLTTLGSIVQGLLAGLGTLLAQLEGGWATIGPQFAAIFNQLLSVVLRFTGTAVPSFASGLTTMMDVVAPLISLLAPLAPLLGAIGGQMGVWVSTARLLDGPLGSIGSKLSDMSKKMEASAGTSTLASTAMGKVGSAISKAAGALPLIGAGVSVVVGAWQAAFGTQDQFVQGLQNGGKAADDARTKLAGNDVMVNQVKDSMGAWAGNLLSNFIPTSDKVTAAYEDWYKNLGTVGQAQADATQAQNQYNYMVGQYGKQSPQALAALDDYRGALKDVESAQNDETHALQDSMAKEEEQINDLLGLVGANLNYQQSLITLKQDQQNVTDAITQHGKASNEAASAENGYQQQILAVVAAAGKQAAAQDALGTKSEQAKATVDAETATILGLAAAAGEHAPPALQQLVNGLTNAEISAYAATGKVDGTTQAILKVNGKNVAINVNGTGQAVANAHAVANAIAGVNSKTVYLNTYIRTIVQGPGVNTGAPGMAGLLGLGKADGGNLDAGMPTLVGEKGPELVFPNRAGFVATANQTKQLIQHAASGEGAPSGLSTASMAAAVSAGVHSALSGAMLRVDGNGVARLVNDANAANGRR